MLSFETRKPSHEVVPTTFVTFPPVQTGWLISFAETESFVTQLPPDCRGRPLATSWSHRMVAYDVTSSTGSQRQENLVWVADKTE